MKIDHLKWLKRGSKMRVENGVKIGPKNGSKNWPKIRLKKRSKK